MMKKVFYLLIAGVSILCYSCSSDDEQIVDNNQFVGSWQAVFTEEEVYDETPWYERRDTLIPIVDGGVLIFYVDRTCGGKSGKKSKFVYDDKELLFFEERGYWVYKYQFLDNGNRLRLEYDRNTCGIIFFKNPDTIIFQRQPE